MPTPAEKQTLRNILPRCKAEALVYSLRDKLAQKWVEALGDKLANL